MPPAEKMDVESGGIEMLEAELEELDSVSDREEAAESVEVVGKSGIYS